MIDTASSKRTTVAIFAVTILVSAFLLFQVQPLIVKIILPWFGGTAAVWSAALLFFQGLLLIGYAYAHVVTRLPHRTQMIVHVGLLVVSCALLPILPSPSWKPTDTADPTFRILVLLAVSVGLPYVLLSSTSPLLQSWYVRRTQSEVPYRLFALSNFGSMLGLLSFPFVVEPTLTSRQQAYGWSWVYGLFVALCAVTAWTSRRSAAPAMLPIKGGSLNDPPDELSQPEAPAEGPVEGPVVVPSAPIGTAPEPGPIIEPAEPVEERRPPSLRDYLLWVGLAASASTLLVAVSTHITQNIAPIPLLWVVPLALYLLTFIIAFESDRFYNRQVFTILVIPALALMAYLVFRQGGDYSITTLAGAFTLGLFVVCMVCHGELARRRPAPEHLTVFYLMVSIGGAVGGSFVALIAPRIFDSYLELFIAFVACAAFAAVTLRDVRVPRFGDWVEPLLIGGVIASVAFLGREVLENKDLFRVRNFYGVLSVADDFPGGSVEDTQRRLYHGTIEHGSQILDPKLRNFKTSYYGLNSGVGRAMQTLQQESDDMRVGVVGLGAGTLAGYGRKGDTYRLYEINPAVEAIARNQFSFIEHSKAKSSVVLGDARLTLEREKPQRFDLIAVDAFSGDAIPLHLLTAEAFDLYFRHLEPDGVLALHITNRYVNLEPVTARGAARAGKAAMHIADLGGGATNASDWVLITSNKKLFGSSFFTGATISPAKAPAGFRAWTDDYSNLLDVLGGS